MLIDQGKLDQTWSCNHRCWHKCCWWPNKEVWLQACWRCRFWGSI